MGCSFVLFRFEHVYECPHTCSVLPSTARKASSGLVELSAEESVNKNLSQQDFQTHLKNQNLNSLTVPVNEAVLTVPKVSVIVRTLMDFSDFANCYF